MDRTLPELPATAEEMTDAQYAALLAEYLARAGLGAADDHDMDAGITEVGDGVRNMSMEPAAPRTHPEKRAARKDASKPPGPSQTSASSSTKGKASDRRDPPAVHVPAPIASTSRTTPPRARPVKPAVATRPSPSATESEPPAKRPRPNPAEPTGSGASPAFSRDLSTRAALKATSAIKRVASDPTEDPSAVAARLSPDPRLRDTGVSRSSSAPIRGSNAGGQSATGTGPSSATAADAAAAAAAALAALRSHDLLDAESPIGPDVDRIAPAAMQKLEHIASRLNALGDIEERLATLVDTVRATQEASVPSTSDREGVRRTLEDLARTVSDIRAASDVQTALLEKNATVIADVQQLLGKISGSLVSLSGTLVELSRGVEKLAATGRPPAAFPMATRNAASIFNVRRVGATPMAHSASNDSTGSKRKATASPDAKRDAKRADTGVMSAGWASEDHRRSGREQRISKERLRYASWLFNSECSGDDTELALSADNDDEDEDDEDPFRQALDFMLADMSKELDDMWKSQDGTIPW
ncbi:hypothetical protein PUNSTDRAFT_48003 [Punctularia strigosozonata HHB-11173 SS5]|uniref:Uncharacterized protein n=1 Tax=Punctularia strigosozonata (strain HHB-11173) TaxID=741275 RepID=R7RZH6_PUNST|nr:uncharacterized protein PUNSTDRAFT_48003 [Punctularia strigosozonata HHB-11173 SS5]EIN03520.1 hypothetical protein PUNSTDRAFT_48003 [Punctularia strigosozonata HHB-11173 SS5]